MKIVKFLGGLGNQMFQYAFFLALKEHYGKVKADISGFDSYGLHHGFELEKVFHIHLEKSSPFDLRIYTPERRDWLTRKLRRIYRTKHAWYLEKQEFGFDEEIFKDPSPRYFWGYWQHHLYHSGIKAQIVDAFQFRQKPEGKNLALARQAAENTSVSIHIRRGDYLGHPMLGDICNLEFYRKAIEIMEEKLDNPQFVVFSNDINWCRKKLFLPEAVFVDWNTGENSYRDMQLMGFCKHHIIANSSFSWWGASLNSHKDNIVIAPKRWVNYPNVDTSGMILPDWITV